MNLLILLLAVIILLLLVIVAMLATAWPGKQRDEIERLGNNLRREILEQRGDNLQLMKSIRIVIEDAVKESVEKEMAAAAPRSRSRKNARAKSSQTADPVVAPIIAEDEDADNGSQLSVLQAIQIPLFSGKADTSTALPVNSPPSSEALAPKTPDPETIHMGYVDDIPDAE